MPESVKNVIFSFTLFLKQNKQTLSQLCSGRRVETAALAATRRLWWSKFEYWAEPDELLEQRQPQHCAPSLSWGSLWGDAADYCKAVRGDGLGCGRGWLSWVCWAQCGEHPARWVSLNCGCYIGGKWAVRWPVIPRKNYLMWAELSLEKLDSHWKKGMVHSKL